MDRTGAQRVVRRIEELPTLPAVIARILEVLEDEGSSSRDLERVVSFDQSISAKVLRIANSAYYGFPREITTIHRAIVLLGFQAVKGLALGCSIFETFFRQGGVSYFDRTAYWLHSIACSSCARLLGKRLEGLDPEGTSMAGLIHDIGMVLMDHVMHETYSRVLERVIRQGGRLAEVEREVWGFDHAEVGAWLGEQWKFPAPLVEAIRFHHGIPGGGRSWTRLPAAIHLADFCSNEAGLSVTGGHDSAELITDALAATGLGRDDLAELTAGIRSEREGIEAFFAALSA
ncbi:MAG: HDOD domain-containing protein [Deltaproteobacteria bacterium]|nr:HDOD domain-containing protein [Deltaproteobacteria bacterium]